MTKQISKALDPTQPHVFKPRDVAKLFEFAAQLDDMDYKCFGRQVKNGGDDTLLINRDYDLLSPDELFRYGISVWAYNDFDVFSVVYIPKKPPAPHPLQGVLDELKHHVLDGACIVHGQRMIETLEQYIKENPVNE